MLNGNNIVVSHSVQHSEMDCFFSNLFSKTQCSTGIASSVIRRLTKRDVLVVFIFDKLASHQFSRAAGAYSEQKEGLPNIKRAIASSSSVSVEYFYPSTSFAEMIGQFANFQRVDFENLATLQEDEASVLHRGGVLMVNMNGVDDLVRLDAYLPHFIPSAPTTYLVTSEPLASLFSVETESGVKLTDSSTTTASTSTTLTGPQYISPAILLGLLLSGFLLLMLVIGVYVVLSIEPPIRFPKKNLLVKKEY